jgi:hypothetical protein
MQLVQSHYQGNERAKAATYCTSIKPENHLASKSLIMLKFLSRISSKLDENLRTAMARNITEHGHICHSQ